MRNLISAFALLVGLTTGGAVSFHHLIVPAAACAVSQLLSPCSSPAR